jgi:hypothetical protein
LEDDRKVADADIASWAGERRADYVLTSAKTGENVEEAFLGAVRAVVRCNDAKGQQTLHQFAPPLVEYSGKHTKQKNCILQ